ncbi:MAG: hypothetical protein ACE5JX_14545 [Acidobacteriota bacterium]
MNHFIGLIILSLSVATVFSLIIKEDRDERIRYFLTLLIYMVVGSFVGGWVMSAIPW